MTGRHLVTLEGEWIDYMKMRVSWIPLITSATTFWFMVTVIFICGYYRKRRRSKTILVQWEEEEKNELEKPDDRGIHDNNIADHANRRTGE